MSDNGTGVRDYVRDFFLAPLEERHTRAVQARAERQRWSAAANMLEAVRLIQPENDGFRPIGSGETFSRSLQLEDADELREQAMQASLRSPHMIGYLRSLQRYVIGQGPTFTPETGSDALDDALVEYWDEFRRWNDWDRLEDEIPWRVWRDGEAFVRRFVAGGLEDARPDRKVEQFLARHTNNPSRLWRGRDRAPDGMLLLRLIAPDEIDDPTGTVSHGIVTAARDVRTVLGYVWAPAGTVKEIIPAADMLHVKIRVDSDVKRGRSALEPLLKFDKRYEEWLSYRLALSYVRTAVALIRKMDAATSSQVAATRDAQASTKEHPDNDRVVKRFRPGTVITASGGIDYEFKNPNLQAQDAQHDGRNILLSMAAATGLPEYMFTGDASNANFASTMVAEGPAIREFEDWQDTLRPVYEQIWRWCMEAGADAGKIPGLRAEMVADIDVQIEYPPMVARDELEHTKANQIRAGGGILSKEGWAADEGIDWEVEKERLDAEREEALEFVDLFGPQDGPPGEEDEDDEDEDDEE